MYVSHETPAQTEQRLLSVIATARLRICGGPYIFREWPLARAAPQIFQSPGALAFVRDEDVWSALVPDDGSGQEQFGVFSFHFEPGLDNSGFVGWLASRLKRRCGTGVFVVCGQNSARGGIFDYWGCPLSLRDEVMGELHGLIAEGRRMLDQKESPIGGV